MATKSKLTKETQKKIVDQLKSGNYIETASAFAGIHKQTLYNWLKRGAREKQRVEETVNGKVRKEESKFVEFSNEVEQAQAFAEVRDVNLLAKAAEENWQAAAWRLERKFPDRWGRKDRIQAEMDHKGEMNMNVRNMSNEELDGEIANLENKLGIDQNGDDETGL